MSPAVGIVGAGAWGLALAQVIATAGTEVVVLARGPERADQLRRQRSLDVLPGLRFHPSVAVSADPSDLTPCTTVVLAVPSAAVRDACRSLRSSIGEHTVLVSATKGLELGSGATMTAVMAAEFGGDARIAVLSGPNIAPEVASGLPAAAVVAATTPATAVAAQRVLGGGSLRCYTSSDVIGVEYGGALKNVVAIAAGVCDGIGAGDNGKAAIITRGLAELARLGVSAGAQPLTFAGLAGLGDCIVTCISPHSRNRRVGEALGRGASAAEALAQVSVAEGVNACQAALMLADRFGVDMPIARSVHRVLFDDQPISTVLEELMLRDSGDEMRGLGLDRLGDERSTRPTGGVTADGRDA